MINITKVVIPSIVSLSLLAMQASAYGAETCKMTVNFHNQSDLPVVVIAISDPRGEVNFSPSNNTPVAPGQTVPFVGNPPCDRQSNDYNHYHFMAYIGAAGTGLPTYFGAKIGVAYDPNVTHSSIRTSYEQPIYNPPKDKKGDFYYAIGLWKGGSLTNPTLDVYFDNPA